MPYSPPIVESHTRAGGVDRLVVRQRGLADPLTQLAGMHGDVEALPGPTRNSAEALIRWEFPSDVPPAAQRRTAADLIAAALARSSATTGSGAPLTTPGTEL